MGLDDETIFFKEQLFLHVRHFDRGGMAVREPRPQPSAGLSVVATMTADGDPGRVHLCIQSL